MEASAENAVPARPTSSVMHRSGRGFRVHPLFPCICLLTSWGILVAAGYLALGAYAAAPGAAGHSRANWPRDSVIPLDARRLTLLMFLHPLCPCSSASVDELSELIARCRDRVRPHVVILRTPALDRAGGRRIGGCLKTVAWLTTWNDAGGRLSRRFGVLTSGHVLLYDPAGRLLFSGGITPARGHRGPNSGRSAVLAELLGEPAAQRNAPTFGCPIFESPPGTTEAHP